MNSNCTSSKICPYTITKNKGKCVPKYELKFACLQSAEGGEQNILCFRTNGIERILTVLFA